MRINISTNKMNEWAKIKRITPIFLMFFVFLEAQSQSLSYGEQLIEDREFSKAEKYYNKILQKDPENRSAKEFLGDIAAAQDKWGEATTIYKELLSTDPQDANYNFKYGGALGMEALEMPKIQAAFYIDDIKEHLIKAAKLDNTHIEARWALVKLYLKLPGILGGSEQTSMKYANELAGISKVDGFLSKAFIAESKERYTEAEENYKMAVQVGGSAHCYEQLSIFYNEKAKNAVKALATYEEAYNKHEKSEYCLKIAEISANNKLQKEKGLEYINLFFKSENKLSSAEIEKAALIKGKLLFYTNEKKKALVWFNKVLQENGGNKEAKKYKSAIKIQ